LPLLKQEARQPLMLLGLPQFKVRSDQNNKKWLATNERRTSRTLYWFRTD
jgi:hypothetical protein